MACIRYRHFFCRVVSARDHHCVTRLLASRIQDQAHCQDQRWRRLSSASGRWGCTCRRGHKEPASTVWTLGNSNETSNGTKSKYSPLFTIRHTYSLLILPTPSTLVHYLSLLSLTSAALTAKLHHSQLNESQRAWRPWHSSTKPQERGSARGNFNANRTSSHLALQPYIHDHSTAPAPWASCRDTTAAFRHLPRILFCDNRNTAAGVHDESFRLKRHHSDTPID
jgi:hypothetical protein